MSVLGAIGIGSGLLSGAASIFGGSAASKAAKKANRLLEQQQKDNQAWYDRRYNEDYTQTTEAQSLLDYARQQAEKQWKRAEGASAVSGATDESVALAKKNANDMLADVTSQIAAQSTGRKDAIEQQYLNTKSGLTQQQVGNLQQKTQNISSAAGQASSLLGNVGITALDKLFKQY